MNSAQIKLDRIIDDQFSLFSHFELFKYAVDNDIDFKDLLSSFEINVEFEESIFLGEEIIHLRITIQYKHKKSGDRIIASFSNIFNYKIENLQAYLDENGFITLEIKHFLFSITIATMRGIIYNKLQGTYLENVILPLFSKEQLVELTKTTSKSN